MEKEAIRKFCEKGQLVSFLSVLLTFLFPNHFLLGQLWISLAFGIPGHLASNNTNGYSSSSDELPDSGDILPRANHYCICWGIRASNMNGFLKKKEKKKKKKEKKKAK